MKNTQRYTIVIVPANDNGACHHDIIKGIEENRLDAECESWEAIGFDVIRVWKDEDCPS